MNFKFCYFPSKFIVGLALLSFFYFMTACSSGGDEPVKTTKSTTPKTETEVKSEPKMSKGIGPIKSIKFDDEINQAMVAEGKVIYEEKCVLCHNLKEDMIGPSQAGVLKRRSPEWIMNLMLNPEEMLKKDPIAKELLAKFNNVPMTDQGLTEEDARKILEFFRTI